MKGDAFNVVSCFVIASDVSCRWAGGSNIVQNGTGNQNVRRGPQRMFSSPESSIGGNSDLSCRSVGGASGGEGGSGAPRS